MRAPSARIELLEVLVGVLHCTRARAHWIALHFHSAPDYAENPLAALRLPRLHRPFYFQFLTRFWDLVEDISTWSQS